MYTYNITYEVYVEAFREWCVAALNTTDDAIEMHKAVFESRADVRNVVIRKL